METKINIAKLWDDFFNKQMREYEKRFQTEVLDFVKDNLKNKKRNAKTKGRVRGAKKAQVIQDVAGPSQKPSVSLYCIPEQTEELDTNFAAELSGRRPPSNRAAAKRATEVTSKHLNQSLITKLRNPGTSESQGRNKSTLHPVEDKNEQEDDEVALKQCSVPLERSAELDKLAAGISNQPAFDSFINDSDMDVFKVPPVPLKKCKVTFQISNATSQIQNTSTKKNSNLLDHPGSQNKNLEKCVVSSSSSVNEKSNSNDIVAYNNKNRESQTISISVTVESTSINSTDSERNTRPARTRTKNKKYNDEEFTTSFSNAIRSSSSVKDKSVSNSTETNKGRGQKRKSDEAFNKSAKIAKTVESEIPDIVINSPEKNINDEENVSSNLVSSSIDLGPSTSKGIKSSVIKSELCLIKETSIKPAISPIKKIKTTKMKEPSLVQCETPPVISDTTKTLNILPIECENISSPKPLSKKNSSLEIKSPSRENKAIVPSDTENVVTEHENKASISTVHSPVKSDSPVKGEIANVDKCLSSTLQDEYHNEKCASDAESPLPSGSSQHSNDNAQQTHPNQLMIDHIIPEFETPKPEPRMTRTRTREHNKKMNEMLGAIPLSNVKKGKENKELDKNILCWASEKKKFVTPLSSAKGPNKLFSPLPKSHAKNVGNASGGKPVTAPLSALDKKKELMKVTTEQQRRKREEKEKRILLQRQAAEKEKQEKLAKSLKEKSEKERKAIAEAQRIKEEQLRLKKQQNEALIREAEERRLKEEAAKLAHLKKMEEEKRKQAELRHKQAEEARKMQEKRLQEKAKEESLAEAAKLKKIKALQNQAKAESYQLTPAKEDRLPLPPKSENDYGLEDENTDDSDDESAAPKKVLPKWASGSARWANTISQMSVSNKLINCYFPLPSCWQRDMNKILDSAGFRNIVRKSSAVWNTPDTSYRF